MYLLAIIEYLKQWDKEAFVRVDQHSKSFSASQFTKMKKNLKEAQNILSLNNDMTRYCMRNNVN